MLDPLYLENDNYYYNTLVGDSRETLSQPIPSVIKCYHDTFHNSLNQYLIIVFNARDVL